MWAGYLDKCPLGYLNENGDVDIPLPDIASFVDGQSRRNDAVELSLDRGARVATHHGLDPVLVV